MPKTRRTKMAVSKSHQNDRSSSTGNAATSAANESSHAPTPATGASPHHHNPSGTATPAVAAPPTPKNKSKRRTNRKSATTATSKTSFQPFQIAPEYEWTATTTQDGKTVFGPPPPPPSSTTTTSTSSSNTTTHTTSFTSKGLPYSVITNLQASAAAAVSGAAGIKSSNNSKNGGNGGNGGGGHSHVSVSSSNNHHKIGVNGSGAVSITTSSSSPSSASSVGASMAAAAAAAAFGNIDLVTMAQSEMINFGVSATTKMHISASTSSSSSSNNKNGKGSNNSGNGGAGSSSNNNNNNSSSSSSSSRKASDYKSVAFHQAKDVLQKYVEGVSAVSKKGNNNNNNTGNSISININTGNIKKDGNNNLNISSNTNSNNNNNNSSNTGGDVGPGITTQPCSDADMKALMSMFVEIMGMSSNIDANGKDNSNTNNNGNNNSNNKSSSGGGNGSNSSSGGNNNSGNVDSAAVNAARVSLSEQLTRLHMQNAAMAMSGGGANNNTSSSNNNHNNNSNNNSNSNKKSGPFPVVSMMFGSGGNNNNNSNNNKGNKNMPNVIPPPPGGWPPGAAAAAAAALAAASNGAASVTVPLGSGSISLPLGMAHISSHHHHHHGFNNVGGDNRAPPEWMRDACNVMNDYGNDYDDGSDISAVNGSGSDNDNDDDDGNNNEDNDEPSSSRNKNKHNSTTNKHSVKPAPQDRTSGAALYKNQRVSRTSSASVTTNPSTNDVDNDTSDAAAAELLREEEEAALKLQEEEEKARRAAKKREKKNRKKEKAKREAAIKAAQAAQKKREKSITSWRSRIASACSGGEVHKMDALISDNPFKDAKQHQIDPDILEELGGDSLSFEEEVNQNMEWLLPSCVEKFRDAKPKEIESRSKLAMFVMRMAFHVVFIPRRDERSAFHTACVVGDLSFVKLVAEKSINNEENPKQIDILCQDLGWSPLHYAAAGGWCDVVEVLLASGCEVTIRTDPARTCLISNEHGVTTKELLEFIFAENHAKNLEFNSDGLQEIIDSRSNGSAADRVKYKADIESLIERIKDVEMNGYSRIETKISPANEKYETNSQNNRVASKKPPKGDIDESKSGKKKKKKKKKAQINNEDAAEESSVTASVSSIARREPEVDLVSMLLAMGFTEDQIHAAVDACGGTDRATADDLVEWILGGGASGSGNNETDISLGDTSSMSRESSREHNSARVIGLEQKQRRAALQATKEAEEAAKRDAEVKAAAERLAAKREEQRRIRREWNNREQARQQEEAKAKLAEEVERKRRFEIERAKAVAQRVAKERAATMMYQDPNATVPPMIHGGNVAQVSANANVGAVPLFPGSNTAFSGGSTQTLPTENQYYPDMHSSNLAYGQPPMQQATTRSYPQAAPNFRSSSFPVADSSVSTPDRSTSRSKSKKASPINIEVNGYEFPVLGANKPSSPSRRQSSKKKDSPNSIDNRKVGRSRSRKKKNETPSKGKAPVIDISSPSPTTQMSSSQNVDDQNLSVPSESYLNNSLGEIRATAKAFVPTHFTPSASPQPPPGLVSASKSMPPGLAPSPATSNPLSNLSSRTSILSNSTPSIIPSASVSGKSILSNNTSTILQGTSTPGTPILSNSASSILPVHPLVTNPTIPPQYNTNLSESITSATHMPIASPAPSTASSIAGLQAEDNSSYTFVNSPMKTMNDDLLGSTVFGGLSGSSLVGTSLGILDSNTNPTASLSGSSIWGGGSTTAPTTIPANTNLGGFSFNFGDTGGGSNNSGDDAQKKENTSSSMWGSGGVSSMSGGGGSIW